MNFHTWTDANGEVLILKRISAERKTKNDFTWPIGIGSVVECPDWNTKQKCGGGLHGWPWGFGLGEGMDYDIIGDIWLVLGAKPKNVIGELEDGSKCKFKTGVIRFEGTFAAATNFIKQGFIDCVIAACSVSVYTETAASGKNSNLAASGKNSNLAASGEYSNLAASGKNSKLAASGENSNLAASGENSKLAASGENSVVAAINTNCIVSVGARGTFALAYWDDVDGWRFLTGKVGENGIEANKKYTVKDGKIIEVL